MKPIQALLGAGEGLLDRTLCVIGAVLFSQVPEFLQQYLQRLGGHLDEARRQLAQFRETAAHSGLSFENLIGQTLASPDHAVAKLGDVMSAAVIRVNTLESAQSALQGASLWTRPFIFLHHADLGITHATWTVFKPALPATLEGLVYALAGMLALLGLYHFGIKYPVARLARRHRAAVTG